VSVMLSAVSDANEVGVFFSDYGSIGKPRPSVTLSLKMSNLWHRVGDPVSIYPAARTLPSRRSP
jgi:hypothetical protein